MHNLFNAVSTVSQGVMKFPEWLYVRDGLRRNLGAVLTYYRRTPMAVKSNHFLVRLLQSITVPQSQNLERYYDNVDSMALNMSMALKMTSSIFRGSIFRGQFYGPECSEILIANTTSFNVEEAHANWQNLTPVEVLRHPLSDLALNLPDGHHNGSESGLAVLSINIPMLAVQYRAFRMNEMYVADEEDSQRSLMQFIHMFVLPNMLYSHLDLALLNRINNIYSGAPMGASRRTRAFYLPSYTDRVDAIYGGILKNLDHVGKNFTGILRSVPTVVRDEMQQVLQLPPIAPTRQVDWALSIARLPALIFLLRASKENACIRNQREANEILRNILFYKTNNTMATMLPGDLYYDVENEINAIELFLKQAS